MESMDAILDASFKKAGIDLPANQRGVLGKAARDRLRLGSPEWKSHVAFRLQEGFGVEDIAIWLNCHVSHVRTEVAVLRSQGKLATWWGKT